MDPREYGRLLRQCRLEKIRLLHCQGELRVEEPDELRLEAHVEERSDWQARADEGIYILRHRFVLTAGRQSGRGHGLKLESAYVLELASSEPLPDEFLQRYCDLNLGFNLWPYFRQWVAETTGAMGLRPLVLGFRFSSVGAPPVDG